MQLHFYFLECKKVRNNKNLALRSVSPTGQALAKGILKVKKFLLARWTQFFSLITKIIVAKLFCLVLFEILTLEVIECVFLSKIWRKWPYASAQCVVGLEMSAIHQKMRLGELNKRLSGTIKLNLGLHPDSGQKRFRKVQIAISPFSIGCC